MRKIILPAMFVFAIASCKKTDKKSLQNDTPQTIDTIARYESLYIKSKTVSIDIATGGSFYGNSCRFIINPNSLMTLSGDTNITGNVDITVREWLTKSDMIFSNLLPVTDRESLISGGEVYVEAKQNGQRLIMKPRNVFQVNIPRFGNTDDQFNVFLIPQQKDYIDDKRVWAEVPYRNPYTHIIYNGDTISIFSDSIGFCNADRFMPKPDYQDFNVNITGTDVSKAHGNMTVYTLYDEYKGIWRSAATTNTVRENHVPNIPVHFVVMGFVNNELYGGIAAATPVNGGNYTVNISKVDPVAFKALVDKL